MEDKKVICRNIQNGFPYQYLGEDNWENMATGRSGFIEPELAKKLFKISPDVMWYCEKYPLVEKLIRSLELRIEKL